MARSSNGWVLPVGVAVVLGGGALWAIAQGEKKPAAAAEGTEPARPRPFEDMPPEEPPPPRAARGDEQASPFTTTAPEGLAEDEGWQAAVKLAAEAEAHFEAATEAKVAGDTTRLNQEGARARALFDQALETTALWEEELLEKWGETDPQVRKIVRTRSQWFDRTRWLHKSIAR